MKKHYNPKPSVIIQCYKFNTSNQKADESISTYVAELHRLIEFCDFGETIGDMLWDKFVLGLHNVRIQHRLLAEKALTFLKAQIAQAMELADKDVQSLQSTPHVPVHLLNDPPQRATNRNPKHTHNGPRNSQALPYFRCGGKHSALKCHFKTEQCHVCGKVGHISKVCRKRPQNTPRGQGHTTNLVENQDTELDTSSKNTEYTLFPIKSQTANSPWWTALTINGTQVEMEIDTGASPSLISKITYDKLQSSATLLLLKAEQIKLRTYTGEEISVLGSMSLTAESETCTCTLPLVVVEGDSPSLVRWNWLRELRLDWRAVHAISLNHSLTCILEEHKKNFNKA